jgi:prepilin-type N-terminal cleavage/methylation domain-containing protein
MRSGFTFIELLIVISVLSIISLVAINSYNTANDRIVAHTELSKLQSLLTNARSQALSDSSTSFTTVKFTIGLNEGVTSYNHTSEDVFEEIDNLDLSKSSDDIIDIKYLKFLVDGVWSRKLKTSVELKFFSPNADCTFDKAGSMVQIAFSRTGSDNPIRYMYFHKKACLTEFLIDDLTAA